MNKDSLKAFVLALRKLPECERRDAVERALRIANGVLEWNDLSIEGMSASDITGTWDEPGLWSDDDSLRDAKQ